MDQLAFGRRVGLQTPATGYNAEVTQGAAMRHLLQTRLTSISLVVLATTGGAALAADWQPIHSDAYYAPTTEWRYDAASVRRTGDKVAVWMQTTLQEPQMLVDLRVKSIETRREFDCKAVTYRITADKFYGPDGKLLRAGERAGAIKQVRIGTAEDFMFQIACRGRHDLPKTVPGSGPYRK